MKSKLLKKVTATALTALTVLSSVPALGGTLRHADFPADSVVHQVSFNHLNSWRPTHPDFIEMAIAFELLTDTTFSPRYVGLEGLLIEGVLAMGGVGHAMRGVRTGDRTRNYDYLTVTRTLGNPYFHQWLRHNQEATSALGALTFADVQGGEYFASSLVPLVYFGVFGVDTSMVNAILMGELI